MLLLAVFSETVLRHPKFMIGRERMNPAFGTLGSSRDDVIGIGFSGEWSGAVGIINADQAVDGGVVIVRAR